MPVPEPVTLPLQPFAPARERPVRALTASAGGDGAGGLAFRYVLDADLGALRIPAPGPARRAERLWEHTCFEAFVAGAGDGGYVELNFSPSTEWAAWSFSGHRTGMTPVELPSPPRIEVRRPPGALVLVAHVGMAVLLPEAWRTPGAKLTIALSAVIEDGSGDVSYWALKHAPGKPDFHHAGGFVIEVAIP